MLHVGDRLDGLFLTNRADLIELTEEEKEKMKNGEGKNQKDEGF